MTQISAPSRLRSGLSGNVAVPLLSLYNGQRGKVRWLGTFFYWYYPAHMVVLGIILRLSALNG